MKHVTLQKIVARDFRYVPRKTAWLYYEGVKFYSHAEPTDVHVAFSKAFPDNV